MKHEYENIPFYRCTDLALASALVLTFPIIEIDVTHYRKAVFVFNNSPNLQKTIKNFWDNTLKVSPLEYFNVIKNLKTRIYTER